MMLSRVARPGPLGLSLSRALQPRLSPLLLTRSFSRTTPVRQGLQLPPWLNFSNVRAYWPQIAVGAGGLVVVYGMSSVSVGLRVYGYSALPELLPDFSPTGHVLGHRDISLS